MAINRKEGKLSIRKSGGSDRPVFLSEVVKIITDNAPTPPPSADIVVTATDAPYTVTGVSQFVKLPIISTTRALTLPNPTTNAGAKIILHNRNTTGFSWNLVGTTLSDNTGSIITSLLNNTIYMLESDGVKWVAEVNSIYYPGINNRFLEANAVGAVTATKEIIDLYITDGVTITKLSTGGNWTAKVYTGTAITGTFQGQEYIDANYFYKCVSDNNWVRMSLT